MDAHLRDEKVRVSEYREEWVRERIYGDRTEKWKKLEAKYGKYLFVPLDIPKVKIDGQKFKKWYFDNAKVIQKIKDDVAGGSYDAPMFYSIDTHRFPNSIWEANVRQDVLTTFPELKTVLDCFPFGYTCDFMLWSSIRRVPAHRDQGPWFDMPCSFRVMVYDENPRPTLQLREQPMASSVQRYYPLKRLPYVPETDSFAWNNLRTHHSSVYDYSNTKILMILGQNMFHLDMYEDLMDRSIAKYKDRCITTSTPRTDFVNN